MDKKIQKTIITFAGIAVLLIILIFAIKSFIPENNSKSIQVNGQSTIKVTPDIITVYYNIETKGQTSKEAEDLNSEIESKLKEKIKNIGIEENRLKTQNFNIYPEYDWNNGNRILMDYKATHSLKIELTINETNKTGDLIDAGTDAGAGIGSINFELSPKLEQQKKAEAIKLASQDARTKAEALAEGFNKKLGKLISVSLNNWGYTPWRVYDSYGAEPGISSIDIKESVSDINPKEQQVSANVNAIYKIK